ncbi:MAG TPA: methyl-accepting chemotaxis protein [Terriglobales bacterium]|nr:methyl-accepting chemotaxis protein [Terriglobales bacterium]
MKGRLSSVLWRTIGINLAALLAVFALAYSAGARSGGLSLVDFGALPFAAGLRLWIAALVAVMVLFSLLWLATRILKPLNELTTYAETMEWREDSGTRPVSSDDDFAFLADRITELARRMAAATADQQELASLRQRISEFSVAASQAASGDLSARGVGGDDDLGRAIANFNRTLEAAGVVLQSGRKLAQQLAGNAADALTLSQHSGRTVGEQEREVANATEAFAALPPSIKQVSDNFDAVLRASQQAAGAVQQAHKQITGTRGDLDRMGAALESARQAVEKLQQSSDSALQMLHPLAQVTENATLLALNAAIESARAGAAGRTSPLAAERFRELAEDAASISRGIAQLISGMSEESAALKRALESERRAAEASSQNSGQAAQALEGALAAVQEASARAEVITVACARQADAARTVSAALQSATDLLRLAGQHARRGTLNAEQAEKLAQQLAAALAGLRASPLETALLSDAAKSAAGNNA